MVAVLSFTVLFAINAFSFAKGASAVPTISSAQAEAWDREIAAEGLKYNLTFSKPNYIIPNSTLPSEVDLELSNNCVGIGSFEDKLFIGFRSAPYHFASS
jgi:hypothetical protein